MDFLTTNPRLGIVTSSGDPRQRPPTPAVPGEGVSSRFPGLSIRRLARNPPVKLKCASSLSLKTSITIVSFVGKSVAASRSVAPFPPSHSMDKETQLLPDSGPPPSMDSICQLPDGAMPGL